jgi:predicted nuclease with TOPRIM domain
MNWESIFTKKAMSHVITAVSTAAVVGGIAWIIAVWVTGRDYTEKEQSQVNKENTQEHKNIMNVVKAMALKVDLIKGEQSKINQTLTLVVSNEKKLTKSHIDLISAVKVSNEFYRQSLIELAPMLNYNPTTIDSTHFVFDNDSLKKNLCQFFR